MKTRQEKEIRLGRIRRILAAFDGSENSRRALLHARRLARQHRARLAVIQVVAPLISSADFGYGPVRRRIVDGRAMQRTKRRLTDLVDGTATSYVRCGSPCAQIFKAAQDLRADLIVMGGHDAELLESTACASTSESTLLAPCPVLIVRARGAELRRASHVHGSHI